MGILAAANWLRRRLSGAEAGWVARLRERWFPPPPEDGLELAPQDDSENAVETVIAALRPHLADALTVALTARGDRWDRLADRLLAAAKNTGDVCKEFPLVIEERPSWEWLEALPDWLQSAATNAAAAISAATAERGRLIQEADAAKTDVKGLQAAARASQLQLDERVKEKADLDLALVDLRADCKKVAAQLLESRVDSRTKAEKLVTADVTIASQARELEALVSAREADRVRAQREAEALQERDKGLRTFFGALGGLGERILEGQKNFYAAHDDGAAAAMLGFLASHSLHQLAIGMVRERKPLERAMLLNLWTLCDVLGDYDGFGKALRELQRSFSPPTAFDSQQAQRAGDRPEARVFHYALGHLRDVRRIELSPYFFFVDDKGTPFRAA